jgi:2-polyprenyl-3-methyl-5-hydroxy-6-metoxy-1,4-benzoquinol methylase
MSEHESYYRDNEAYAEHLAAWDPKLYSKYADTLRPEETGARVLDVGCGVGQVVARLNDAGFEAHGVDVSKPNIERASKVCPRCQIYDGKTLPFADNYFASAGALNVLEHVEEPEAFIREIVRVVKPSGKIILSSPNFFRVLGFRDYHPRMRGIGQKLRNWKRLREKRSQMRIAPDAARFDRMQPIVKEPFTPDDDAIVATNAAEMEFFLEHSGCEVLRVECTDRYVARPVDFLLNTGPWRYVMFNSFLVARKRSNVPA